jgi:hypothetical protein
MENNEDQTLEGGAGEATDTTEGEPSAEPQTPEEGTQSGEDSKESDPLDAIKDPEVRAEAKRARAEMRRREREGEKPQAPSQSYASAKDIELIVTNQAKELVSDEVRDNWEELQKIPLAGYDPKNARSIAENMQQRMVLLKAKQPQDNTRDLSASSGARGTSKSPSTEKKSVIPRQKTVDQQAKELYGE